MEPVQILLVEDNPSDIELTLAKMRSTKMCNRVHVVEDGEGALDYLHRRGRYIQAVRPDLVLLDLNLPGLGGLDVLRAIKTDEQLHTIPVVILTSSEQEVDALKSYELQANAYIPKPVDIDGYQQIIRAIDGFWLSVVKLPPRP